MQGLYHVRIFPVLILVAFLAFSVRLIDFAAGVSSLSGVAQAMDSKDKSPVTPADDQVMPDQSALGTKKDTQAPVAPEPPKGDKAEALAVPVPGAKAEDSAAASSSDSSKWRDASDEEPGTQKSKMDVLKDLAARRETLDKKEQELQTREALLRAAEQEIDRKYQELSSLRGELENLLEKQSEEEKARIVSLVKVYENMKPKEAARIFDTLDIPVLMSVMSKMSERKLSPIMASMDPERAKIMTIMLAEEKSLPTLPSSNP